MSQSEDEKAMSAALVQRMKEMTFTDAELASMAIQQGLGEHLEGEKGKNQKTREGIATTCKAFIAAQRLRLSVPERTMLMRAALEDACLTEETAHKYGMDKRKCDKCKKVKAKSCCSKCKSAYYCGVECQRSDWKEHKVVCKKVS